MVILELNNKQKVDKTKYYKCTCKNCGSVFVFDTDDISRPRCMSSEINISSVICPNKDCKLIINIDEVNDKKNDPSIEVITKRTYTSAVKKAEDKE